MNYSYGYGNYVPSNNKYTDLYSYSSKMNYSGDKATMTFMKKNNMSYDTQDIVEPYMGLVRGNLFGSLYEPYKNYKAQEINVDNERASMLGQFQMYNFAVTDLNLYLDVYPNDNKAFNLLKEYSKAMKDISDKYVRKYGPLTIDEDMGNNFEWINSPWPWEASK